MKTYEGNLLAQGLRVGIIAARFNEFITSKLVGGAMDALRRHGCLDDDIELTWVPGAFEIPLVAQKMANSKRYDVIICLGAVIRGATPHFDLVSNEVSKGIAQVGLQSIEQAIERAGTKAGNKGFDAAMTAIETANLLKSF